MILATISNELGIEHAVASADRHAQQIKEKVYVHLQKSGRQWGYGDRFVISTDRHHGDELVYVALVLPAKDEAQVREAERETDGRGFVGFAHLVAGIEVGDDEPGKPTLNELVLTARKLVKDPLPTTMPWGNRAYGSTPEEPKPEPERVPFHPRYYEQPEGFCCFDSKPWSGAHEHVMRPAREVHPEPLRDCSACPDADHIVMAPPEPTLKVPCQTCGRLGGEVLTALSRDDGYTMGVWCCPWCVSDSRDKAKLAPGTLELPSIAGRNGLLFVSRDGELMCASYFFDAEGQSEWEIDPVTLSFPFRHSWVCRTGEILPPTPERKW